MSFWTILFQVLLVFVGAVLFIVAPIIWFLMWRQEKNDKALAERTYNAIHGIIVQPKESWLKKLFKKKSQDKSVEQTAYKSDPSTKEASPMKSDKGILPLSLDTNNGNEKTPDTTGSTRREDNGSSNPSGHTGP